jgi:fibronectin-binding autotransporter adhesin
LTFDVTGYTLSSTLPANTLTFAGTSVVSVTNANDTATIDAIINSAIGLTKNGAGKLVLGGANTISAGTITVNAGTLEFNGDAANANGVARNLSGAGTFIFSGTNTGSLSSVSTYDLAGTNTGLTSSSLLIANNSRLIINAVADVGSASLSNTNNGQLYINNAATYNNSITLQGIGWGEAAGNLGALRIGTSTIIGGTVTLAGDARITTHSATAGGTISGAIGETGGARALEIGGSSVSSNITLSGTNTYTGGTIINGTYAITGSLTGAGTTTLNLNYVTNNTSKLSDSAALTFKGTSVLSLAGATGSHAELVSSTILDLGAIASINRSGANTATINLGALTRNPAAALTVGTASLAKTSSGTAGEAFGSWFLVGTELATKNATNDIIAVTYTDVATGGTLVDGTGTSVRITGAAGAVTTGGIAGDTLTINTLSRAVAGLATIDVAGKTLRIRNGVLSNASSGGITIGTAANSGNMTAGAAIDTAATLEFNNPGGNVTVNSTITNNGTGAVSVVKLSAGELILSGTNTYTGGTTVNGGTIRLLSDAALGTGSVTLLSSASFGGVTGGPTNVTINNNVALNNAATLTYALGFTNYVGNGILSGNGGVTVNAGGSPNNSLTLTNANTYTGATAVTAGRLLLANGGSLANTPTTISSGAVLGITQNADATTNSIGGAVTLNAGAGFTMADGFISTLNAGSTAAFNGGTGSTLNFNLGGTTTAADLLAITGAVTSTGITPITITPLGTTAPTTGSYPIITAASGLNAANFSLSQSKVYYNTVPYAINLATSATAVNVVVPGITGLDTAYWKGDVDGSWATNNAGSTNWSSAADGLTDSAAVPNEVTDVFLGATGAGFTTTFLGSDLSLNSLTFGAGSVPFTIAAGNTLTLRATSGLTAANGAPVAVIKAPLTLTNSPQIWTNNSTNLLQLGAIATNGMGLTVAGSGTTLITGALSGAAPLTKAGTGLLVLSGANTYTTTTIGSGNNNVFTAIQIGNGGSTGTLGSGAVTFGGYGNNLIFNRTGTTTIAASTIPISGAGNLIVKNGTLVITSGGHTYTGDTQVMGGTLTLSSANFNSNARIVGSGKLYVLPGGTVTHGSGISHVYGNNASPFQVAILGGTYNAASGTEFYVGNLDFAGGTLTGSNSFRNGGSRTNTILPSAVASQIDLSYSVNGSGTNTATFLVNDGPAASDLIVSKSISSGTSIVKSGLGMLRSTTSTAHAYTGTTVLNGGIFNLDFTTSTLSTNMLNAASAPTFAGGNLTVTGRTDTAITQTLGATTLNAGGSSITLTPGSGTATVGLTLGAITRNVGATIEISNTGTLNTSSGTAGTIFLGANGAAYATYGGTDWAAKAASGTAVVGLSSITGGYTAVPTAGSVTLTDNADLTDPTAGTYTLSATSTPTTVRNVTVAGNTLALGGFNLQTGGLLSSQDLTISGTGNLQAINAGGELVLNIAGGTTTISSLISNNSTASSLTKTGAGTLVLANTAANTYSGMTYLNGGITRFSALNQIGNTTGGITFGGGTLQWTNTLDITSGRTGTVVIGTGGATFDTNNNNVTFATAFGAGSTGTLTKTGAGTLTLNAAGTNFTGSVVINGGKIVATGGTGTSTTGTLGSGAQSVQINAGGILELNGGHNHSVAEIRNYYVNGGTLQNAPATSNRIGNVWLNGGTLNTQNGSSSNYTAFYLGTLQANTQGANATIFVEGTTPSFITTTGTSNTGIQLGPNVLFQVADVTATTATDLTVSVPLLNQSADQNAAGAFTKRGTGTMTLTAANTFTGGITVDQGTVQLATAGLAFDNVGGNGGGMITVNSGATLNLAADWNAGYSRPFLINGGTLTSTNNTATDSENYLNNLTLQNGATVSGNPLRIGYHSDPVISAIGTSASTYAANLLTVNNTGMVMYLNVDDVTGSSATDLTFSGVIGTLAGAGLDGLPIVKLGTGTVAYTGGAANTYTGLTTVSAGTLLVGKDDAVITLAGNVLVNGTGTLATSSGASGRIADTANVTIDGPAAQFQFGNNQNDIINVLAINNGGTVSIGNSSSNLSPNGGITSTGGGSITGIAGGLGLARRNSNLHGQ